jgi:ABC-type nitrate/sulfonate/bicarbonate transport system permease component
MFAALVVLGVMAAALHALLGSLERRALSAWRGQGR